MLNSFRFLCLAASFSLVVVPCESGESAGTVPGRSRDEAQPASAPESVAIAEHIKELGSPNFDKREGATKALNAIGLPALDALRKAAKSDDAEVARRAFRLVQILENSLDQLLVDYRAYGLPLPPANAKLVRFESGGGGTVNGQRMPPTYMLGFLLESASKDKPALLFVGTQQHRCYYCTQADVVEPNRAAAKDFNTWCDLLNCFPSNVGLAIALQCQARGWNELAQELATTSLQDMNVSRRSAVAYLAWAHYQKELLKPHTDRSAIARQMKRLLGSEPGLDTPENCAFLQ